VNKQIRNIAIFAHVDAGKTSITEQLLYHSGTIRTLGSVDSGNTQTDTLEVEKQRGITVNSSIISFQWDNCKINLIDTPGHIDFSSETQKAFLAIDSAIVVISAVEGIQAQTENLINLLIQNKKPFLIFINKIDRIGSDIEEIITELHSELKLNTFPLQSIQNEASNDVKIQLNWNNNIDNLDNSLIEKIVEHNEELLNDYFEGKTIPFKILNSKLISLTHQQKIIPVFMGSAKYNLGIDLLLNGIESYLPNPKITNKELSGIIFKTFHQKDGKWLVIRLFSGEIQTRTSILNASQNHTEKVSMIKSITLNNSKIVDTIQAGDIALIKGVNHAKPGDFIGEMPKISFDNTLSKPLLSVQVIPNNSADVNKLVEALNILHNEDPDLDFFFIKEEREFHIKIHGNIQKEILQSLLKSRFNLEVSFSNPTVIYKETPTAISEGYVRYWMPKPCWAIMKFKIEPLKTGKGIQYESIISVNDVKKQYQNDVKKTIPTALKQGVLGWEVDDIKITLIEGEDHEMHTKSNDFAIATPMGIMDGLSKAKMTLLEPVLSFKIKTPEQYIGNIQSELVKLRAKITLSEALENKVIIAGEIPLATSLEFPIKLSSITSGKAKLNTKFLKYQKCDSSLGKTRDFKGISPLDTAKYILKARKALS
jgi:ribosomal protection tetracycline resistance protein